LQVTAALEELLGSGSTVVGKEKVVKPAVLRDALAVGDE